MWKNKSSIKRLNKKIAVKEVLMVILILFVAMTGIILTQNINNLDTMWVFSFASKIADGAVPYADFNMVVTPLSSQITAIFLSVFGNTMMVSAFVGVMYGILIFLMQYLILRKLNVSSKIASFIVLIMFLLIGNLMTDSYNMLAILLVHILFLIEIYKIRYDKYFKLTGNIKYIIKKKKWLNYTLLYNIVTGIILGLIILSKQNIGVVSVLAITIYYFVKCIYKDITFKEAFLQLSTKATFCILAVGVEGMYLFFIGALYPFIDYTVLGLFNFANKVNASFINAILYPGGFGFFDSAIKWVRNLGMIFSFLFLIAMLVIKVMKRMTIKNKLDINVMILSISFMFVGVAISIPLANLYHLILTATFIEFLFLINFVQMVPIKNWLNENISKLSHYIIILIPLIMGISYIAIYSLFTYKCQINKFENMYISSDTDNTIKTIVTYIDSYEKIHNQPLYMITSNGVMYSLAMDRNNGIFDLPQYGNLGKEDYMKVINKLDSMSNFSVMIFANESDLFWQEPKEISEYIKENYEYVEEFDIYKIYRKMDKDI